MSGADELFEANERFAGTFAGSGVPARPARRVAVLTCMDARMHPETFLGLDIGDAHMIRNAGGRASDDALRSLVISNRLLGTHEYLVIHHTDCGMLGLRNDDLRAALVDDTGADASEIDFLPFSDLDQSVRDDVERIRASPFLPDDVVVTGYVYDVADGRLRKVE